MLKVLVVASYTELLISLGAFIVFRHVRALLAVLAF